MTGIITNNHWKPFLYRNEVPQDVLDNELDWCDDEDGFFKYRDWYYSLSEFMRIDENNPFRTFGYDGYKGDSCFSGVLIKVSECGEAYKVATYLS